MNSVLRQFFAMVRRYPLVVFSVVIFLLLSLANYFLWDQQKTLVRRHEEVRKNGESMLSALSTHSRITTSSRPPMPGTPIFLPGTSFGPVMPLAGDTTSPAALGSGKTLVLANGISVLDFQ